MSAYPDDEPVRELPEGADGCPCGSPIGELHDCPALPTCGGEDMHPVEPEEEP